MESKKTYVKPFLVEEGTLHELTQSLGSNNNTDKAFPSGTPHSALTFS
jgi:hypothetical protein